jgi:hypothetical protein
MALMEMPSWEQWCVLGVESVAEEGVADRGRCGKRGTKRVAT